MQHAGHYAKNCTSLGGLVQDTFFLITLYQAMIRIWLETSLLCLMKAHVSQKICSESISSEINGLWFHNKGAQWKIQKAAFKIKLIIFEQSLSQV